MKYLPVVYMIHTGIIEIFYFIQTYAMLSCNIMATTIKQNLAILKTLDYCF